MWPDLLVVWPDLLVEWPDLLVLCPDLLVLCPDLLVLWLDLLVLGPDLRILGHVDVVVHGPRDGDGQHDALKQDVKQELESLHRQLLTEKGHPAPLALR